MYLSYFGLTEPPFSIAPSPRYLYMSGQHQEALAHLLFGLGGEGGFILLSGEVGTGKTTVCRSLLEQIPDTCDLAYIFNPKLTVTELLSTICAEFGISCPPGNLSSKTYVDHINAHLLDAHARGRHAILVIDEAQNLSAEVLEQMRLLTNLETNERKLLQIVLIGQPELVTMLARPELRQLAQRIVARYHLGPLDRSEVGAYVRHRLHIAGSDKPIFPARLMGRLQRLSGGIPRLINLICDRALLGASVHGKENVDRATLNQAAREVFGRPATTDMRPWLAATGVVILAAGLGVWQYFPSSGSATRPDNPAQAPDAPSAQIESPPARPDHLAWPDAFPSAASQADANAALFKRWGLVYLTGDPCEQATLAGLRCHSDRGGLTRLLEINLPARLSLRDTSGASFQATLVGIDEDKAIFDMLGEVVTVAAGALAAQWSGDFTVLWRPPVVVPGTLRPGDRGEGVAWLIEHLARALGKPVVPGREAVYDDALGLDVRQFQLTHGLVPDGAVGRQTLIRLVGAADPGAPKLRLTAPTAGGV